MTDNNPYAPPNPLVESTEVDPIAAARLELSRPASAIIIMASIHSVFDAIPLVSYAIMTVGGARTYLPGPILLEPLLLFSIHVFQAICGAQMGHLKSIRLAYVGAVLVTIPLLSPFYVLGIPFGVWALVLLRKPRNRAAFRDSMSGRRPEGIVDKGIVDKRMIDVDAQRS